MKDYRTAAEEAEDLGVEAFFEGIPLSENPFSSWSIRRSGPALAAWWSAGWKKAERDKKSREENP